MESVVSCSAILWSVSTFTRFASSFALASAIVISLCAFAFAICAALRICSTLSIPMFSMVPTLSVNVWMLKFTTSIPSLAISGSMFARTLSATIWRFWTNSVIETVPIISRILPSRTCWTSLIRSCCFIPRSDSAARSSKSGREEILRLDTPSTLTLINSVVGTASDVFTSTCITLSEILSTLSKNGILQPALPIRILFLNGPEIM